MNNNLYFKNISCNEFFMLSEEWSCLIEKIRHVTPFQMWEWQSNWWKHLKGYKSICVITIKNSHSELVGLIPLWQRKWNEFIVYEFIGSYGTDYLDFILHPNYVENIFKHIIKYIEDVCGKYCIINLVDIPDYSKNIKYYMEGCRESSMYTNIEHNCECFYINTGRSWEYYLNIILSRRMKQDINSSRRKLKNMFNYKFVMNEKYNYFQIEKHMDMHQKRMQTKGHIGTFASNLTKAFFHDFINDISKKGIFRQFILTWSDCIISSILAIEFKNKLFLLNMAFDENWKRCSVGTVLISHCIEYVFNNKIRCVDFSRGSDSYKYRWKCDKRDNFRIIGSASKDTYEEFTKYYLLLYRELGHSPRET